MAKMFAAVVMMSLVSGCAIRGEYRGVAYAVDGTMVAAGAALAMVDAPADAGGSTSEYVGLDHALYDTVNDVGVAMVVAGLAGALANALVNWHPDAGDETPTALVEAPSPPKPDAGLAPLLERPGTDPEVVRMTRLARASALGGRCNVVRRFGERVEQADASYYAIVFRNDRTLRTCL